ncbi:UDP-N-acetylmuramoyl-tripeptide--D-alanyl-D-alanine ligase [Gordonia sp. HNM0687]|uniref:UDP-N-acetylmuramoyl-tripeptide--D-alanyl-D-alanine ligase n=1 Tax=Gordonia mangrovi TaxID=2665643 RepID=A0A6L7GP08_9ACTN|nr:UDP-N-acetylmuramoyl-tripeptide--D-alanyl-D-alanine ligase [Gordonia mangrovi]MXP21117.1 UDP-N-acetylmuramoyl-tripeptide--D-alanyl-D-alanine ligase [Gordonia mangrovi]UVF78345.1 UDP-N-acetylmuramoyl-tripeptide--D-alanyl-D-alanine ligase [Gordonia mangrovi]
MAPTVLVAPVSAGVDEVRAMLRDLVEAAAAARSSSPRVRTWAVLGELPDTDDKSENERVIEHDRLGRQAVRLAVDKTMCVGHTRAVRALHQGAVMEGSWGDEVRMVATADEAGAALADDPRWRPGSDDVILVAGADPAVMALAGIWQEGRV